ncbi:VWA domain-containing protein [Candidatus Micrarchaeota archaeon]|nr:VWA domain-containing protein [Candidatus Micrarchaeota archaeon]
MKMRNLILGLLVLSSMVWAKPLLLIIDASGSMDDTLPSGQTKLETAKQVALETVDSYSDSIALMVYTDCDSGGDPNSGAISVWTTFTMDKATLRNQIQGISASYSTPIANSIIEGTTYIKSVGNGAQMLVLTDGEETCGYSSDVTTAVSSAQASGVEVKVVGFALSASGEQTVSDSVTQGGGKYYGAGDELELKQAFSQALGTDDLCCVPAAALLVPLLGGLFFSRRLI